MKSCLGLDTFHLVENYITSSEEEQDAASLESTVPFQVTESVFTKSINESTIVAVDEVQPTPGVLSRAVDGVVSWIPSTAWFWATSTAEEIPALKEINCVHHNWYGRRLTRKFRFCIDSFYRVHPETGEIRKSYKYEDILKVIVKTNSFVIIQYKENMFPEDWIEATPSSVSQILGILSNEHIPVERESAS